MKKLLLVLLSSTGLTFADTFSDLNEKFNDARFKIVKKEMRFNDCSLESFSQKLSSTLNTKPTSVAFYADMVYRKNALNSLMYQRMFHETEWVQKEDYKRFDSNWSSHEQAVWVMRQTVDILFDDPFSAYHDRSGGVYAYLGGRLEKMAGASHPYFKEQSLTHLIPASFFDDFLKILINMQFIYEVREDVQDTKKDYLEHLSNEAALTLVVNKGWAPVTLTRQEGFLCLPKEESQHLEYYQQWMCEGAIYFLDTLKEYTYSSHYLAIKIPGIDQTSSTGLGLEKFDQDALKIFYSDDEVTEIKNQVVHDFFLNDYLFNSRGKYGFRILPAKTRAEVLKALIRRYGSLDQLKDLEYYGGLDNDETGVVRPLGFKKSENENNDVWAHSLLFSVEPQDFMAVLEELKKDLSIQQHVKEALDRYIAICQLKKIDNSSFSTAAEKYKKLKEQEENQRRLEEERKRSEAYARKIQAEHQAVECALFKDMVGGDQIRSIKELILNTFMTLLTDRIDGAALQKSRGIAVTSPTLTDDELFNLQNDLNDALERGKGEASDETLEGVQQGVWKEVDLLHGTIKGFITATFHEHALMLEDKISEIKIGAAKKLRADMDNLNWAELLKPLKKRQWPGHITDPEKLAAEKDEGVAVAAAALKWGTRETIMNVAAWLKARYNNNDIPLIETKDLDDSLRFLARELGMQMGDYDYEKLKNNIETIPFLANLTPAAKNVIRGTKHLNEKDGRSHDLIQSAKKLREDFIFVINLLHGVHTIKQQDSSMLFTQFEGYMEEQGDNCYAGLKSRLFLARLDIANFLKNLYVEGVLPLKE